MHHHCHASDLANLLATVQSGDVINVTGYASFAPPPGTDMSGPTPAALTLKDKGNITILAHGTILELLTPGNGLMIFNCQDVLVEGLSTIGPGKLTADNGVYCAQVLLHGQNLRLAFRGCRFTKGANHGIGHLWGPRSSYDSVVSECSFSNGGNFKRTVNVNLGGDGAAIAMGSRGLHVTGCLIEDWFRGIEVEGHDAPNDATGVRIHGNRLERCAWQSILVTPTNNDSSTYRRIAIHDNVIQGCAIRPDPFANCGIYVSGCDGLSIKDNTVEDLADGIGILVTNDNGYVKDAVIQGNIVRRAGRTGIFVGKGVGALPLSRVRADLNYITDCGGVGLHMEADQFTAAHNTISQCAYVGMEMAGRGQAVGTTLHSNQCRDGKGPTTRQCVIAGGVTEEGTEELA